jgi:hypothetical protein
LATQESGIQGFRFLRQLTDSITVADIPQNIAPFVLHFFVDLDERTPPHQENGLRKSLHGYTDYATQT